MDTEFLQGDKYIQVFVYKKNVPPLTYVISKSGIEQFPSNTKVHSGCNNLKEKISVQVNQQSWHSFMNEIKKSNGFRQRILECFDDIVTSVYVLINSSNPNGTIDYAGGRRLQAMVNERVICDTAMSYLSTLGGAFSALGDSFSYCADKAGEISLKQFQIALRLGEEPLAARCRIYMALSLIQRGNLKLAQGVIIRQYNISKRYKDNRLANMCQGVWAKLKYTKDLHRNRINDVPACAIESFVN